MKAVFAICAKVPERPLYPEYPVVVACSPTKRRASHSRRGERTKGWEQGPWLFVLTRRCAFW
jgi:hypothetical protein